MRVLQDLGNGPLLLLLYKLKSVYYYKVFNALKYHYDVKGYLHINRNKTCIIPRVLKKRFKMQKRTEREKKNIVAKRLEPKFRTIFSTKITPGRWLAKC